MKEVIFLLVISIIILGFVSGYIIPLFRDSMDIVGTVAQKEYKDQKIKNNELVPLNKNTVKGCDVIGVIRFYHDKPEVTVEVNVNGNIKVYSNNTYNPSQFYIPYEGIFECNYDYLNEKLIRVSYISR